MNYNSNFYLLNKPKSWTSQDLCTKFKKTYKFNKVGHSGTLDPNAEGLMLVATNSFTKLFDYIEDTSKSYYVKALLGYSSDTLDVDSDFKKTDNINSNVFEKEIQNLELLDFKNKADKNNLLFIGSSSIRLWNDIENDMQPYKSVKRGYGGAHYYDLIHFTERLISNHSPRAILIFVANDITGSNDIFKTYNDLSPKEVKKLFKYFFKVIENEFERFGCSDDNAI